jgi:hypothetical protein
MELWKEIFRRSPGPPLHHAEFHETSECNWYELSVTIVSMMPVARLKVRIPFEPQFDPVANQGNIAC